MPKVHVVNIWQESGPRCLGRARGPPTAGAADPPPARDRLTAHRGAANPRRAAPATWRGSPPLPVADSRRVVRGPAGCRADRATIRARSCDERHQQWRGRATTEPPALARSRHDPSRQQWCGPATTEPPAVARSRHKTPATTGGATDRGSSRPFDTGLEWPQYSRPCHLRGGRRGRGSMTSISPRRV
jgi:hypothetical protein